MATALIVEDKLEANRLLTVLVQPRGHATRSAFTGDRGLALARSQAPNLVFLELMHPNRNWFDVRRALNADPSTTAIPVVMVSARLAPENRVEGFQVDATDCIPCHTCRSGTSPRSPTPGAGGTRSGSGSR